MKKSPKVLVLLLFVSLALIIGIVGCAEKKSTGDTAASTTSAPAEKTADKVEPAKEITIRYGMWGSEAEINAQKENALGAEKVYPGLKIEVAAYPDSATFWQKLPAEIAAKTAPDVLSLSNEGYYEYVAKGNFVSIDNEIKEAGVDLSKYSDSSKAIWTVDNKLYGIPTVQSVGMFFINTDMWQAAGLKDYPKTWDEVKTAAKALTTKDVYGLVINIHPFHLTNYALTFGGGWSNGKTINSDANVKALDFIVSMFQDKLATSPKAEGFGWDGEVFANKKAAMTTGGWWYKGFLKGAAPDLKYAVLPMPEGTTKGATSISTGIVVLKDAPDKLSAVKAAAYMAREEALLNMMDKAGIDPAMTSLSAKYYEANPEFKATESIKAFAKDFAYPAETTKFNDSLQVAMESKILKNDTKTVKEILDELQNTFNK